LAALPPQQQRLQVVVAAAEVQQQRLQVVVAVAVVGQRVAVVAGPRW